MLDTSLVAAWRLVVGLLVLLAEVFWLITELSLLKHHPHLLVLATNLLKFKGKTLLLVLDHLVLVPSAANLATSGVDGGLDTALLGRKAQARSLPHDVDSHLSASLSILLLLNLEFVPLKLQHINFLDQQDVFLKHALVALTMLPRILIQLVLQSFD